MSHTALPPFAASSGPRDAKITLVGEAWGEQEALLGRPFVGSSGQELTRMLRDAGIDRDECFLTNVLAFRPPNNSMDALCTNKAGVPHDYSRSHLSQGKYLKPEYLSELERLYIELEQVRPNLCVALGNTAAWATTGSARISAIRGTVAQGQDRLASLKVLPTYHPAAVMRQWSLRPIVLADFMKAKREAAYADIRRPHRRVTVSPTLEDLTSFNEAVQRAGLVAVDIETSAGQITHVGFATSPECALCVPFLDRERPNWSYWPTPTDELGAWNFVKAMLELPTPKVFQNGLYDLGFFVRYGIAVRNASEDTMLRHHVMYPELQKGLGFLGSIYTGESSWKLLRGRHVSELKADDE